MNFKKSLEEGIVKPNLKTQFSNTVGTVISYDSLNNRADVFVPLAPGRNDTLLEGVPVQIAANGFHQSNLKSGDEVYVQFANSSYFQPKIIGLADEIYQKNTRSKEKHLRKGSLLVEDLYEFELDEDYTPSSKKWLDYGNSNEFKTIDYKDKDPIEDIAQIEENLGFFNDREVGIVNPASSSIVKVMDNGDILIFSDNNIGLKINTLDRRIDIIGTSISNESKDFTITAENISIKTNDLNLKCKNIKVNGKEYECN